MPGSGQEPPLGESTAPLALSELASIMLECPDKATRVRLADWGVKHIQAAHFNFRSRLSPGAPGDGRPDALDLRLMQEEVMKALQKRMVVTETKSGDGEWLITRVGVVLLKD